MLLTLFWDILVIFTAYLMGSISSAIITCRLMGLPDPRTLGSKNPGATNVLRIGGKSGKIAAAITLFGDSLKGFIPVLVVTLYGLDPIIIALVGVATFLGHLYPLFFAFKGGKGVATAFGVILATSPWVALALLVIWLVVAFGLKISSLSALIAAVAAPVFIWLIMHSTEYLLMSLFITVMLIIRHRSNISNLLSGSEDKIS
ncbi:MAG: glycerol-3-phosphate 1-O-acyltransferase PlsY [Pseudomonadota bacterium]